MAYATSSQSELRDSAAIVTMLSLLYTTNTERAQT